MANIRQIRNKIFNEMAKRPFESGDFDENDDVDQNSEKSPKSYLQVRWGGKGYPTPPPPQKKEAKMARNRNGDFEGDDKFAEHG